MPEYGVAEKLIFGCAARDFRDEFGLDCQSPRCRAKLRGKVVYGNPHACSAYRISPEKRDKA